MVVPLSNVLTIERQYSVQMNAVKTGGKGFLGSRNHRSVPVASSAIALNGCFG
jgi:hypothetical protein